MFGLTRLRFICALLLAVSFPLGVLADFQPSMTTEVAMLGTGTPNPNPARSGSAIAIIVNDTPYIVDFGTGVVRQAASLSPEYGGPVKGLEVKRIKRAFLTHLHSDHSLGFADLILTPWIKGRDEPLQVFGPNGVVEMAESVLETYKEDISYRRYGSESANDAGWRVEAHAIEEGVVYKDENVTVEAFHVRHGSWPNAFGYRFTTPDRVIVISGDTAPTPALEKYGHDADILIHQAYSAAGLANSSPDWQEYMRENHTSTLELAELAIKVKPKLLVLYHVLLLGSNESQMIAEIKKKYDGEVVIATDLDVY